jgi:hypothetical protein
MNRLISSDLTSDQIKKLKGTGKNGMLTKGDVLKAMGQIKSAYGSAEKMYNDPLGPSGKRASEVCSIISSPCLPLHSSCSLLTVPLCISTLASLHMSRDGPCILMSRK